MHFSLKRLPTLETKTQKLSQICHPYQLHVMHGSYCPTQITEISKLIPIYVFLSAGIHREN
jgi:hypothetical protein